MTYLVVCAVALVASALTLYSGFGLGTLLLPAFALFFPVELAVAATAVVHLLNNLFKLALVGRYASGSVVLRFGGTAVLGALAGAWLLTRIADSPPIASYELWGVRREILVTKLVIAGLIALFALLELSRLGRRLEFTPRWLPFGGALSGFFGGLSGHQGALRSAFLIQCRLDTQAFIGTGVTLATIIDLARMSVYGSSLFPELARSGAGAYGPVLAATAAAFLGAWIGVRRLGKVTMAGVRRLVGVLLLVLALALATGLI